MTGVNAPPAALGGSLRKTLLRVANGQPVRLLPASDVRQLRKRGLIAWAPGGEDLVLTAAGEAEVARFLAREHERTP